MNVLLLQSFSECIITLQLTVKSRRFLKILTNKMRTGAHHVRKVLHREAAVHAQALPGDKGGGVGGKKQHRFGHLAGGTDAA